MLRAALAGLLVAGCYQSSGVTEDGGAGRDAFVVDTSAFDVPRLDTSARDAPSELPDVAVEDGARPDVSIPCGACLTDSDCSAEGRGCAEVVCRSSLCEAVAGACTGARACFEGGCESRTSPVEILVQTDYVPGPEGVGEFDQVVVRDSMGIILAANTNWEAFREFDAFVVSRFDMPTAGGALRLELRQGCREVGARQFTTGSVGESSRITFIVTR